MSWEEDRGGFNPQGGALKPGYMEEKVESQEIGGDGELLELMDQWTHQDATEITQSFNDRGDDLLEGFLQRHFKDLSEGVERRLREYLNQLERHGRIYSEEGGGSGAPMRLRKMLQEQVVPIVEEVLRSGSRRRQAVGQRDFIPGRATTALRERAVAERRRVTDVIAQQTHLMPDYARLQELQSQQLRGLSTSQEMEMYSAQTEVLKRQIYLWSEENRRAQGAFGSTIARLEGELQQTQAAVQQTASMLYGEGAAAAQAKVDRSTGRPRQKPVRDREMFGAPPRRWDPSDPDYTLVGSRPRSRSESMLRIRGGGRGSPSPSPDDYYDEGADADPKYYQQSGAPKKRERSPSVQLLQTPSPSPVRTAAEASEDQEQQAQFNDTVQEIKLGDEIVGYKLPLRAPPFIYELAYGAKAKSVLDLFRTNHRFIDYTQTAKILLFVMMGTDDTVGLDKVLPDSIMRVQDAGGQNKRDWAGKTLRTILSDRVDPPGRRRGGGGRARARLDFGNLKQSYAIELVGKGRPKERTLDKARPIGLLVEMFQAWSRSAAAERAGLNVDPMQIVKYHRAGGALLTGKKTAASVSRGPSEFREGVEKMGGSRADLRMIGTLFGSQAHKSPFNAAFWRASVADQLAHMKKKKGTPFNPAHWATVLEDGFHVALPAGVKNERYGTSYSDSDVKKLWLSVSKQMGGLMNSMGNTYSADKVGDYLAAHAAQLNPSISRDPPSPRSMRRRPSRKDRSRSPSRGEPDEAEEEAPGKVPPRQRAKPKRGAAVPRRKIENLGLPPFPKTGSYPRAKLGSHLYVAWGDTLDNLGGGFSRRTRSETLQGQIYETLKNERGNRMGPKYVDDRGRRIPSDFKLYKNLRGNRKNEDLKSFKIFLDKAGWNEYINNLGDWLSAEDKKKYTFPHMPDSRFLFTQVFRSADRDEISDMLQKWVAVRMWNRNTQEGRASSVGLDPDEPKPKPLELNVKEYWDAQNQELFETYAALKVRYDQQGETFPVPGWKDRLDEGNQYGQLTEILSGIASGKEKFHERYSAGLEEDEKAGEVPDTDAGRRSRSRMQLELETDEEASPFRRKRKKKSKRSRARPAHIPRAAGISGGAPPPQRRGAKREDPERGGPLGPIGVEAPGPGDDPLMDAAEEEEAEMDAYFARAHIPVYRHNNRLRAEVVLRQNYEALNGVHLLQTDNNVQPVMGAVHIVHPASHYNDKHFMLDIEGDINEGQKVLVKRSKRGPFKDQSGRSTVMDRSAHVTYRKRAGAFEITIRRGVLSSELQQMVSKLNMHRMSIHGSHVVIIKGTKRYRLGPLGDINMKYLLDLVGECVQQYGSCGLEITEAQAGTGALYKGGAYSARFKSNARKGQGVAAAEWERVMGRL